MNSDMKGAQNAATSSGCASAIRLGTISPRMMETAVTITMVAPKAMDSRHSARPGNRGPDGRLDGRGQGRLAIDPHQQGGGGDPRLAGGQEPARMLLDGQRLGGPHVAGFG